MSVSKSQLIDHVALAAAVTKADATRAINALLGGIVVYAVNGNKVIIQGFGTFEMKTRPARTGRNPQTGLPIEVPAKTTLTFRAAKTKA